MRSARFPTSRDPISFPRPRALGLENEIGSLDTGKRADLIGIDFSSSPHATALHDEASQIVHCARPSDVKLVMVEGEILMERGIMKRMDEQKILRDGQKTGIGLVKRMGD